MEITIALLAFSVLLSLMLLGLVFSCFLILIKARAAGKLGEPAPNDPGGKSGDRPPNEERVNALIAIEIKKLNDKFAAAIGVLLGLLTQKQILTRDEAKTVSDRL